MDSTHRQAITGGSASGCIQQQYFLPPSLLDIMISFPPAAPQCPHRRPVCPVSSSALAWRHTLVPGTPLACEAGSHGPPGTALQSGPAAFRCWSWSCWLCCPCSRSCSSLGWCSPCIAFTGALLRSGGVNLDHIVLQYLTPGTMLA